MSVEYRAPIPDRMYTTKDFYDKGIILTQYLRVPFNTKGQPQWARFVFRSNGLLGTIRYTCYGTSWAVDIQTEWGNETCLTTECKTIREAKSILYAWFKGEGFVKPKTNEWRKKYLEFSGRQPYPQ